MERVSNLASESPVVIFTKSSCGMCHTIKCLFSELGVKTVVHEIDEVTSGREIERVLARLLGRTPPVPAVFVGGRLVGSTDKIMSLHLGGNLVTMLRNAGAMWL